MQYGEMNRMADTRMEVNDIAVKLNSKFERMDKLL